ncbi:synaptic plasticity regulator PANTS-like [Montipora foliosa]|uniref:synaptic plasticity regulator PANTS-like n=1 Tax=Montipora foliosa TaxID=591990 RepID=UPI0035F1C08C
MMSTVTVFKEQNLVENDDLTSTEFKAPRCLDFFDMWRFCASARNQFHQYYIYGKFQDCSVYSKALGSCISYKATKSSEDRDVMLKAMKTKEIKFTSSSVWKKRENPHEYWNGKE